MKGIPDGGKQVRAIPRGTPSRTATGFFIQDSFRATSRLTLNYGVRWDYFGVTGEKNGQFYTFDLATADDNVPTNQLYGKDCNNFAPRARLCLRRNRQGKDCGPRRMGPVLRRVFSGYVPRPLALELRLLPGPGVSRHWARKRSRPAAWSRPVDRYP